MDDPTVWRRWFERGSRSEAAWAPAPIWRWKELSPTAESGPVPWRVRFEAPGSPDARAWMMPDAPEDAGWQEQSASFGQSSDAGIETRTRWPGGEIWMRRELSLPEAPLKAPRVRAWFSGATEVYLNGVLACRFTGNVHAYENVAIAPEAIAALRPGRNVLAVHGRAPRAARPEARVHLDVGLIDLAPTVAQVKPRARDLGVPFDGTPGPLNAITDVRGVEIGHSTLIRGDGPLRVGSGPVRTGVTAILPRGRGSSAPAFAGWFSLNGNGEMTGTAWIEESGRLEGPVMITNTHSVGTVRDAVIAHQVRHGEADRPGAWWSLPVVAETFDGYLNDVNGFHVKEQHVFEALDSARSGHVPEGNVGGGTGMICYEFKGGIGTASRRLGEQQGGYTVGVLVQANHGSRGQLRVAGVPVGQEIAKGAFRRREAGSIIIVVATDAPLLPHQLKRLARRAALGLARTGAISGNGSGDLFLAFSTANPGAGGAAQTTQVEMLALERMDPLFAATVQATEESIINALVAAETMKGANDHEVIALPHDRLQQVLKQYNRLIERTP
jgi:L-aminopeptidase/D-esterase-like protein